MVADHQDETREARLVAELQRTYADAILAGDAPAAETVIREAIDAGLDEVAAVVGFTTATSLSAVNLPAAIDAVRRVDPDAGILVGGRGVAAGLAARPDVVVCRHVADAVPHVDALVKRAGRN